MKSDKYIGVYKNPKSRIKGRQWLAQKTFRGTCWKKYCRTEREAAIAYDTRLIELGLEPVNILTKKSA